MEPIQNQHCERESEFATVVDKGSDSVSPYADSPTRPWLLQDWIALVMSLSLSILFLWTTWTTASDWPHVINQLRKARDELKKIEPLIENPEALKKGLEQAIQVKSQRIAQLRSEISKLDEELRKQKDLQKATECNQQQASSNLGAAQHEFDATFKAAMSELNTKTDYKEIDFEQLWKNGGPGDEPDIWFKRWRLEWKLWDIRKRAYEELRGRLNGALGALDSAKKKLEKCEETLDLAKFAAQKTEASLRRRIDEIARVQKERNDAEEALNGSLVEPEPWVSEEVRELRKRVRNSDAMHTALFLQNLPTIFALFVVSVSALTRLSLLRHWFKPRTLIRS